MWINGLIVAALMAAPAYASETPTNEILVRYANPQDDAVRAHAQTFAITQLSHDIDIVNAPEGVVKLRFADSKTASRAKEILSNDSSVLSVSENHLYKPALKLEIKKSDESDLKDPGFGDNWASIFSNAWSDLALPPVMNPPAKVINGIDPLSIRDWAMNSIHMPSIETLEKLPLKGGIITAVIDTGVDYNHEDLSGAMWRKPGNESQVGFDFAHNSPLPFDVVKFDVAGCLADPDCSLGINQENFLVNPGHGTHCAGHVGAVANNSIGIRGVGTVTKIMGVKFFYDAGEPNAGNGDDAAAVKSIDFAIQNGAKVISASWGGRITRASADTSEIKAALIRAQQAGVIVVIAAGNDAIDNDNDDTPDYPAAYPLDNIISVAAVDSADELASFSSFGETSVHIAAPGVKILSTTVGSQYDDVIAHFKDKTGKMNELDWDGTSMATPLVAGAVALVWAKNPTENYHQIRERILKSARHVKGLESKVASAGVLDVNAALGVGP